jgi:hypothetical protein
MDVLIELIHSLGFQPIAALPIAVSIDFDVDQWTFFKFEHADLLSMFGMEVHELNPWISLAQHIEEQVQAGRPVLVEVDSYFLPDTAGSAYKLAHVKSTVAVNEIDIANRHMGYFHGQGYYHLTGQDFADAFQLDGLAHERMLPPYIEFVKLHRDRQNSNDKELVHLSLAALNRQLGVLPSENPFHKFQKRFERDLQWLLSEPIETFHGYSFATLRQYGACYELVETYLQWLKDNGEGGLDAAIQHFHDISATAKQFQFKLARAIARRKPLDAGPLDRMADDWERGTNALLGTYS